MVVSRHLRLGLGALYLFLATPVARAALDDERPHAGADSIARGRRHDRRALAAGAPPVTSLPALVGLPLALAWRRLSAIGRGFVWTSRGMPAG